MRSFDTQGFGVRDTHAGETELGGASHHSLFESQHPGSMTKQGPRVTYTRRMSKPVAALSWIRPTPAPRRGLTVGLSLVVVATAFEALAVATILPITSKELGGLEWYGWTFSAFMLANLVGVSVGGSESDRRGGAPPFLWGTVLFTVGLIISGLAPSMAVIVLGRTLQGFGGGLLSAVAYAAIARAYPVELQPRMLATLSSAWVVPGLVGPGLAGLIAEYAGWRWVFLGLAPWLALATQLVLPALRAMPREESPAPRDHRNWVALRLALGTGTALAGMDRDEPWIAVVLLLAGGAVALQAIGQLVPDGTLRARRGLPAAIAVMGLLNFAFFGAEAFLPLALNRVRGMPVSLAGFSLTSAVLCWTAGAWLPVRLGRRVSQRSIIVAGLVVVAVGIAGTLLVLVPSVPAPIAVAAWGVAGLGMGLAFTTASAAILGAAPKGEEGTTSAALQLAQVLGAAIATGAGGAVVAAPFAGDPPRLGLAIVDLLMLGALALAIFAARGISPSERPTNSQSSGRG